MIPLLAAVIFLAATIVLFAWTRYDARISRSKMQIQAELDRDARADTRRINLEILAEQRAVNREWIEGQVRLRELDEPWKGRP